jgi:hypothetical protein
MDETMLKIRILARAELTLAQVHARLTARRMLITAIGIGLIVLTVAMVNVGLFHLLVEPIGEAGAAFAIAAINAVLGGLLILVAGRLRPGPEESIVQEIREMALSELSADANQLKEQVGEVTADLRRIRSGVGALTGAGGLGGLGGLVSLGPVVGMLIDALKSRKA